jgi:hypothetical protein
MKPRGEMGLATALLVGGGLVALGMALERRREEPPVYPPPPMASMAEIMLALRSPSYSPPAEVTPNPRYPLPLAVGRAERLERERLVRVFVYRIQRGELVLASPEIPPDLSPLIADRLEGFRPPLPCGNAEGAMPIDWLDVR